jgi:hypothetical protein
MSTLVTNELVAQPGHRDNVTNLLLEILGESLQHDGCETIRILRDQDDPDHVAGLRTNLIKVGARGDLLSSTAEQLATCISQPVAQSRVSAADGDLDRRCRR